VAADLRHCYGYDPRVTTAGAASSGAKLSSGAPTSSASTPLPGQAALIEDLRSGAQPRHGVSHTGRIAAASRASAEFDALARPTAAALATREALDVAAPHPRRRREPR